jgi:hypothetical protein
MVSTISPLLRFYVIGKWPARLHVGHTNAAI